VADAPPRRRSGSRRVLLAAAIALAAFNLRPAVTSVGAILRELQAGTGMSDALAGVLTSVPVIAFGVVGLVAARSTRRLGLAWALVAAMAVLAVGLLVRVSVANPATVIAASAVALSGIAVGNILLPVAVKRWFPDRVGWATGLYAMSLSVGTAAAAAATVPIARIGGGWRAGLGSWALPVVLALVVWVVVAGRTAPVPGAPRGPRAGAAAVPVHRNRQAWALAVFFGTQSLAAYTAMGWLPTIYQDAGVAPAAAGLYLALVMIIGAPIAIVLPVLAARRADQRAIVALLVTLTATAYAGLMLAPATLPALWAVLLGAGFGAFPLALTLIGLRATTSAGTSQLSSLTQGVGYLIAAGGPVAVGVIHEATGGWTWPLIALLLVLVPQLVAGLTAAKPGHVDGASA
jgi:CP family cyanate transporter-like MFS transporter